MYIVSVCRSYLIPHTCRPPSVFSSLEAPGRGMVAPMLGLPFIHPGPPLLFPGHLEIMVINNQGVRRNRGARMEI